MDPEFGRAAVEVNERTTALPALDPSAANTHTGRSSFSAIEIIDVLAFVSALV